MKNFILILCLATFSQWVYAQNKQITGRVVDTKGEAAIGASILEKGTTNGTITDFDGNFKLTVGPKAVLQISYIGYKTQEIPVANKTKLNITMEEDTEVLDEVVVVGYGAQKKESVVGAISQVSSKELLKSPAANISQAIAGKISGVITSQTSGAPGADDMKIYIRGRASFAGDNQPLILVDGVEREFSQIAPDDIESISTLKDASATAIYGAQGANGVIIITTKQGTKSGRVRVSYDGYFGVAKMANSGYDLLNGWEAMEWQAQGMRNVRDYRGQTPTAHPQFGSLNDKDELTMPYAIKPAGLSKDQVISQFGSIDAWVASYKPDGSNSWSRSAYYQMLEDGYSEAEAQKGTNWYDMVTRTGKVQDHQISLLGGGEKGTYSASLGYTNREGTIISSFFKRYSLRANSTYNANKYFTIGQNSNIAVMEMGGERGRQGDASVFAQTYTIQPWVPVYNVGGDYAGSQASEGGRANTAYQTAMNQQDDWTRFMRLQSAAFAELKPILSLIHI